ncbi:hypothetical protein ACFR9U_06650 [Halorientalis brevis]|uniref:Uncharacterized protein n=1 Tax=Halorientalis brevis TaxID=1126241 RepID=A0ABD6C903_9EURY|nr:hypothetical protein [Halorientalis brevis]
MTPRAAVDVEDLLKILLVLAIVWILLEIISEFISVVFGPFRPLFGLLMVVLIALYLTDRI